MNKHEINIGRRGPVEIIYNILYHINRNGERGMVKTHIMYACNLNWKQLEIYLNHLTNRNIIKPVENSVGVSFYLTDKGIKVLRHFNNLFELLSINNTNID